MHKITYYAHSLDGRLKEEWQPLEEHLQIKFVHKRYSAEMEVGCL